MPSFDVVSKLDIHELDNVVNQSKKELATRYDFQGTGTEISVGEDPTVLTFKANSEDRLNTAYEMFLARCSKRGLSLKGISREKVEKAALNQVRQLVRFQQGIPMEKAKELIQVLKGSGIKVQGSIQGDQLRVTGKNKDDLQKAIALLREKQDAVSVDLQFTNFRD